MVLDFVGWLREHNDDLRGDERAKAGFYGLDLYSLYRSMHEVISYLERVDPAAAARARERTSASTRPVAATAGRMASRPRSARASRVNKKWSSSSSTCNVTGCASHLFEEPGALEQVARLARDWFTEHLGQAYQNG